MRYTYVTLYCTRNYNIIYKIITRARTKIFRLSENLSRRNFSDVSAHIYVASLFRTRRPTPSPSPHPSTFPPPPRPPFLSPSPPPVARRAYSASVQLYIIYTWAYYPNLRPLFIPRETKLLQSTHTHNTRTRQVDLNMILAEASTLPPVHPQCDHRSRRSRVCRHYAVAIFNAIFKDSKNKFYRHNTARGFSMTVDFFL